MKALIDGIQYEGTPEQILRFERLKNSKAKLRKNIKPVIIGDESFYKYFATDLTLHDWIDLIVKDNK
ncbi:hypothetical protein FZC83_01965 [Rossellomorea marisflavi]|uniref:Uncharacterized protein n=1 Tax=Rossellomorea marisflavi TaxID=189381 RepID=A0A5D4S1C5_9BACI|nr:hypothetical protein [Rossellomorea marisflavi]TYS56361.1 hypothetical protein FZC83_01965 [Rossellomorea marisflavi]